MVTRFIKYSTKSKSNIVRYIKEMFDTKNYNWVKPDKSFRTTAKFKVNDIEYFVNFDEISLNVYNLYFYFLDDNNTGVIKLIKDNNKSSIKVLSNVRNCTLEFLEDHTELEFFGFSSIDKERDDLYMMFLQNISKEGYYIEFRVEKIYTYYYLVRNDISKSIKDKYFEMFIKENKIKKNI